MNAEQRYTVRGYSGRSTEAVVSLEAIGAGRRARRGVVGLAGWWSAALVCVFIPIAHFVLVPGCLGMGLVSAIRRLTVSVLVVGSWATCPDCGAQQELDLSGPWRGVSQATCRECQRALQLTAA